MLLSVFESHAMPMQDNLFYILAKYSLRIFPEIVYISTWYHPPSKKTLSATYLLHIISRVAFNTY